MVDRKSALSPQVMLATSVHAQPGVYALLLGSGVSTGAGIPTGWGVVKDLVRRVAVAADAADTDSHALAENDPEQWWTEHGEGSLGYDSLLAALAPTPAARQGLLADYFEPSDDDREEGVKVPSPAHNAIAQLVKKGYVRVILTTNFDRLTEQALEAAGVSPQVIALPEAVKGMAPLAHAGATVIKLHGDYKDLGSRNTPEELGTYPDAWNDLLDQILDEYGLIVCGWSAEWDKALVERLDATPNRRYPLYWDARSGRGETAQRIIAARDGRLIPSSGADELFNDLAASVEALERLAEPPLTTAMAIARLKKYLLDPTRRIDLHDLVMEKAQSVVQYINSQPVTLPNVDGEAIEQVFNGYLDAVSPLVRLMIPGVWHDVEGHHDDLWVDALQILVNAATTPISGMVTDALDVARRWPALILYSSLGTAAAHRGRDELIIKLAQRVSGRPRAGSENVLPAVQLLHLDRSLQADWVLAMPRWNGRRWIYPGSHLMTEDLREFFTESIPNDDAFTSTYRGLEYRLSLLQETSKQSGAWRAATGEYVGETGWTWGQDETPHAEVEFVRALSESTRAAWTEVLGIEDLEAHLVAHREVLKHLRRWD